MRILICGDRNWGQGTNADLEKDSILSKISYLHDRHGDDLVIIEGAARGADSIAGEAARRLGVKLEEYPAAWSCLDDSCVTREEDGRIRHRDLHGRPAGVIRNKKMLDTGVDLVLAFHNDIKSSRGTKNMVEIAKKDGVEVWIYEISDGRLLGSSSSDVGEWYG